MAGPSPGLGLGPFDLEALDPKRRRTSRASVGCLPMGFELASLSALSPYLYHVTYSSSLPRIRRQRRLECAATLLEKGNQHVWLRQHRDKMLRFDVDSDQITLTDQLPINEKNIAFQDGWTLPNLIESINRRVFFWRGSYAGLLRSNQGQFGKYERAGHQMVFIRASIAETNRLNSDRGPEVCKHNSGAARKYEGVPIPRGPNTFVRPSDADFQRGEVQEVVFCEYVILPDAVEVCAGSWEGPWKHLF